MMEFALTGANGFLGWHVRCAAHSYGWQARNISLGNGFDLGAAVASLEGTSRLVHLAGVNRGGDEVRIDNLRFAQQLIEALRRVDDPPEALVYANSIQAGNGTPYGTAKSEAGAMLQRAADELGLKFYDIELPNIFGEHGKPFYNSVVATFCSLLADGQVPTIEHDKELRLLHSQDAADVLLGVTSVDDCRARVASSTVSELNERLSAMAELYRAGEIPDVLSSFSRNLFNTYRSFTVPAQSAIPLVRHADDRGSFFEIVRSNGGQGQSSFSTTIPDVSRGDHYHRRKIERFTVLAGEARISMRKLFSSEVIDFHVNGEAPVAIDMPTMWAHNITNTGSGELFTSFWANETYDPRDSDTIAESV